MTHTDFNRIVRLASTILLAAGAVVMALDLLLAWPVDLALPLVVLMLGAGFFVLEPYFHPAWRWAPALYLPGSLLLMMGLIFLLNVLTGDWNAWAYAWLLLPAALGLGLCLAAWSGGWPAKLIRWGTAAVFGSLALFAFFGVIAGGKLILIAAPVLFAAGGLALRYWLPEPAAPASPAAPPPADWQPGSSLPDQSALPEPLSAREIEVLRLIDQGLTNAEIADRLTLAHSTVKTHINNIYGKLGVTGRVPALRRARELRLL